MNRDIATYEDTYNDLPFEADQAYLRRVGVLELLEQYQPKSLLEVGCGMHPIFTDYQTFDKLTVVEPGDVFAGEARKLAEQHDGGEVNVITAFLENAKLEGESFDMILLVSLLHEVDDPLAFLQKASELGSKGTKYLINVPNEKSFHRQLAVKLGLIKAESEISDQQKTLQQNRIFNQRNIAEALESVGLKVLESNTVIFKPFTHGQMQKMLDAEIVTREQMHAFCSMMHLVDGDAGSEITLIAEKI